MADTSSPVKSAYLATIEDLHDQTVRPGGQWDRAKTYGSQLWPDVQWDLYLIDNDDPYENSGAMNYWNPSGAELLEFLRSGFYRARGYGHLKLAFNPFNQFYGVGIDNIFFDILTLKTANRIVMYGI